MAEGAMWREEREADYRVTTICALLSAWAKDAPRPEAILGRRPGETRLPRYRGA